MLATDRRQLARAEVSLDWPPRNSVMIGERREPKPKSPAARLAKLRKKVAALEEAVAVTDADVVAARAPGESPSASMATPARRRPSRTIQPCMGARAMPRGRNYVPCATARRTRP